MMLKILTEVMQVDCSKEMILSILMCDGSQKMKVLKVSSVNLC